MHSLILSPEGLTLAGVMLARRAPDGSLALTGREGRIRALLTAAYGPLSPHVMNYIRRASELLRYVKDKDWDDRTPHLTHNVPPLARAYTMLSLTGLNGAHETGATRMRKSEGLLDKGMLPEMLIAVLEKDIGDESGDEEDDGEDAELDSASQDEDGDPETSSGSGHYNPDKPRIPAGQLGGGQWTTAGNGTTSDSGSISADDIRNNPSDTDTQVGPITPMAYTTTQAASAPSFSALWNNYPTYNNFPTDYFNDQSEISIWELINGHVDYNAATNPQFDNTCAIRLSYALNQSGYPIPPDGNATISGEMLPGDTTKTWYYYRVDDLAAYLDTLYGTPDEYAPSTWKAVLAGQTGIVFFKQQFSDANGHMELFDGNRIINYNDPRESHDYSNTSSKILFWPVK